MSTQKGNCNRLRPQKHQNQTTFKNDLYDKSNKTKFINSIEVKHVCERCKKIIEWKIKYKKYKPLKTPAKCIKCEQKNIKHAYHNMCLSCAAQYEVCAKCGDKGTIIQGGPDKEETIKLDIELQNLLKELPERKRRTFIRYINRNVTNKKGKNIIDNKKEDTNEGKEEESSIAKDILSKENLLLKLNSLMIKEEDNDDFNIENDIDSN